MVSPAVICIGEALVDRLGPLGGDPSVGGPVDDRLGGAPANVACGLARLGTPVGFFGCLGDDLIGEQFSALFQHRGVESSGLQMNPDRPSRIVLVRRNQEGERQFQGFAGDQGQGFADQALGPIHLPKGARWLLVGTIPLATATSASTLKAVLDQARQHGTAVALDVNWRPMFWDAAADPAEGPSSDAIAVMRPLLEQAALIKLAREEAIWLFGSTDPQTISAQLPQAPNVVVTDGAEPVRWWMDGASGTQPAFQPQQVVDTTGAGDAFTAGLLHRWAAAPAERIRFAAACGALVCGGKGGIDPQPTEAQVVAFLGGVS
jgi:fructokinase